MVKNSLANAEVIRDAGFILGWEDPLEEMATVSSILAGKSHGQRKSAGYSPWGHKSQTQLSD